MVNMEIEKNIRDEIIKFYKKNNISYTLEEYYDPHLLMIDYFEILRKRIYPKKREVVISKELKKKLKTPDLQNWLLRFQELKEGFENGDDMNKFLSKRHKDSNFRDRLLTCWRIHHIHFYPERTKGDMLLFAVVTENIVYMVDIIPHNKRFVFSTYNLLNIIYDNWKFLYEPFKLKEIVGLEEKIRNDKDIQALRKAGVCTAIEIRGEIYCLDMMTTSGHSSSDVMLSNNVYHVIYINEKNLENCRIETVVLTGYHRPCFIIIYRDEQDTLRPLVLGS